MFQSTPPRGRRPAHAYECPPDCMFQSTPPRGRRRQGGGNGTKIYKVSIHASAWEATCSSVFPLNGLTGFNPRLRVGGDHLGKAIGYNSGWFQSTPPRGRRRGSDAPVRSPGSFNPRLRVGGDGSRRRSRGLPNRFNPRLRVGGDDGDWPLPVATESFNPRLRVGGDGPACAWRTGTIWFQSTPPRGRRHPRRAASRWPSRVSIHASAWEATPLGMVLQRAFSCRVSIHASAWEATC